MQACNLLTCSSLFKRLAEPSATMHSEPSALQMQALLVTTQTVTLFHTPWVSESKQTFTDDDQEAILLLFFILHGSQKVNRPSLMMIRRQSNDTFYLCKKEASTINMVEHLTQFHLLIHSLCFFI